jgi:hypothetical protein
MIDKSVLNGLALTAAGSTQTDAAAISVNFSPAFVSAAGDDIAGIRLPIAAKGKVYFVKNLGTAGLTSKLKVYPATGDTINGLAINIPIQMAQLTAAVFVCFNSTAWYTFGLLPS